MKYTYLIINLLTVFFPVILSFDKRVRFYQSWKYVWPGIAITGLCFLCWDALFTIKGVWLFNAAYITGISLFGLPLEELLFFLTVPFACLFIYACLNYYVKWNMSRGLSKSISNFIMVCCMLMLVFYYNRVYTAVTFGLLLVLIPVLLYIVRVQWFGRFYTAYVVWLIPFYLVNGVLTSIPIVMYNNSQNMAQRIGTIPVEDHFYLMALLLMNIAFFEYFKNRNKSHDTPA